MFFFANETIKREKKFIYILNFKPNMTCILYKYILDTIFLKYETLDPQIFWHHFFRNIFLFFTLNSLRNQIKKKKFFLLTCAFSQNTSGST